MNDGIWLRVGAVWGFLAVAIGAFGAHGLKDRLAAAGHTATFQTGVDYHIYMAFALLTVGLIQLMGRSSMALHIAGWMFLVGSACFSISIYLLCLMNLRQLWWVTPTGGLLILIGWAALAMAAGAVVKPSSPALEPVPATSINDIR